MKLKIFILGLLLIGKFSTATAQTNSDDQRKVVIIISQGLDNERASVAWSIAKGGIKNGMDVSVFLVSSGVDWVRKGAAAHARLNPLDPSVGEMIQYVIDSGSKIGACPPCLKVRGMQEPDLIDGVTMVGSAAIYGPVSEGAAVLNF